MHSKCCVPSRKLNYDSTDPYVTTFAFPDKQKEPDMRARWVKFVSRKNWIPGNNARVCINHFEPQYVKIGDGPNGRSRLKKALKPLPTIFDPIGKVSPVV